MGQSNIIVAFPCITSISDINLLLLLKEIIAAKSLHRDPCFPEIPPSLTANTSLIVHGDYQYASSQYLRHVNSNGRPLGFSSTMRCTCLSEISSVPDISNFTSDDHASLVIRVIQCITARHHSKAGQCEREQADFDSAG
jgi:hypothetical protein